MRARAEKPGVGDCLMVKLVRRGVVAAAGSFDLKKRGPRSKQIPVMFRMGRTLYAGFAFREADRANDR